MTPGKSWLRLGLRETQLQRKLQSTRQSHSRIAGNYVAFKKFACTSIYFNFFFNSPKQVKTEERVYYVLEKKGDPKTDATCLGMEEKQVVKTLDFGSPEDEYCKQVKHFLSIQC